MSIHKTFRMTSLELRGHAGSCILTDKLYEADRKYELTSEGSR
jgi:hypothetical protein